MLDNLSIPAREPPRNIPAEQALLGAVLANNKAFHRVAEFLKPEHFYEPIHARVFQAIARRIEGGGVADGVTLKAEFEHSGVLDEVGGTAYLAQLLAAMVGIINAGDYGIAIRDAWIRRELIDAGEQVVNDAFGADEDTGEKIVARAIARIEDTLGRTGGRTAVSLDDAVDAAIEAAENAQRNGGPVGLSTGFPSLDAIVGGLEDGTLNVLAGRPGMGKSSLGFQIALNVAGAGIGVFVMSLEMSARELGRRAIAVAAGVPIGVMKRGTMSTEQGGRIVEARRRLRGLPLTIEDGNGLMAGEIALKARAAHRKHGVGLIVVDHLHIVRPEDADARHGGTWAVGRISGAMKRLAKNMRCPMLLLAQLNRGVEGREDKHPTLADLRQAGEIEQDADSVAFVYRPEYYLQNEPERAADEGADRFHSRLAAWREKRAEVAGRAEVIFAKIRDDATGTAILRFHGETASFAEGAQW